MHDDHFFKRITKHPKHTKEAFEIWSQEPVQLKYFLYVSRSPWTNVSVLETALTPLPQLPEPHQWVTEVQHRGLRPFLTVVKVPAVDNSILKLWRCSHETQTSDFQKKTQTFVVSFYISQCGLSMTHKNIFSVTFSSNYHEFYYEAHRYLCC